TGAPGVQIAIASNPEAVGSAGGDGQPVCDSGRRGDGDWDGGIGEIPIAQLAEGADAPGVEFAIVCESQTVVGAGGDFHPGGDFDGSNHERGKWRVCDAASAEDTVDASSPGVNVAIAAQSQTVVGAGGDCIDCDTCRETNHL